MTEAGWTTDAECVASSLEDALNLALGIQSPSERMKPIGENAAAGIGVGLNEYDAATRCCDLCRQSSAGHGNGTAS